MLESSDKPTPEEKPAVPGGPGKPGAADPVQPTPRSARSGPAGEGGGAISADTHISLNDLMVLARTLSGAGSETVDAGTAERGTLSREQRKFSRGEAKSASPRTEEPSAEDAPSAEFPLGERLTLPGIELDSPAAAPRETPLPTMQQRTRRSRSSRPPGLLVPAAILLTLAVICLAVWPTWKWTRPAPVAKPGTPLVSTVNPTPAPATPSLNPRDLEVIDKIMAARRAGESAKALALCVLLRSQGATVPGLSYQEALSAADNNDLPAAAVALNRSLQAGEEISACYLLRAALLSRQGRNDAVAREYEAAAHAAPFAPTPFFFWGESLRRDGHPQAALVRFDEAIARAPNAGSEEFYCFKRRLTLIELDRAAEFADELKARLAQNPPSADWLLTAAAQELRGAHYAAAAGFLSQAGALMDPEAFKNRLRDYYFFGFAHEASLARIYAPVLERPAGDRPDPAPELTALPTSSPSPSTRAEELVSPVTVPDLAQPSASPAGSPAPQ